MKNLSSIKKDGSSRDYKQYRVIINNLLVLEMQQDNFKTISTWISN